MKALDWERDHAASGWRSRAWMGEGWELIAYDDGRWEVRGPPMGHALSHGVIPQDFVGFAQRAKKMALLAYKALR